MAKFIGRLVNVGIAKESVRGTAVAPTFWTPKMTFEHDDKVEQVIDESSYGIIEDSTGANITQKFSEGSVEGRIQAESFGLWLLSALGSHSAALASGETIVYDHTFSVLQSAQHPSLTLSVKDPNAGNGLRYTLSMLDSLEITAELKKYVSYKASVRGNASATGAALTPSYVAEEFFLPQHTVFKVATNLAGLGAATEICIKSAKFTISKNVEDDQCLGDLSVTDRLNKQFQVEGTLELVYNNRDFIDSILISDVAKAMRIQFINDTVTLGVGTNPAVTFDFANVKISEVARKQGNDEIVTQTVSFKAFYSPSDSKSITAVLTNLTTTY